MRNLLLILGLMVSGYAGLSAQCNSNGNGNAWGQGGNAQAQAQAQPVAVIPAWVALQVCQAAQPLLYPSTMMSVGQLFQAYRIGTATIVYLGPDPGNASRSLYRYTAPGGGGAVIVILEDL